MKAIELIASSLNRRDDQPNQELAVMIIETNREDWVNELVDHLHHKDKNIQSDCIKVLYEIGERGAANMIAPYCKDFGKLLTSNNNRLVWGAMIAIDSIATIHPKDVYELLPQIISTIDKGSVITIDHGVGILAKIASRSEFADIAFPLLTEQLKKCPAKQFPMYAEKTMTAINQENQSQFIELIQSRMPEMDRESQKTRLRKLITKLIKH